MLSHTYRLSGDLNPTAFELDPDNTLYWRSAARRLEFESLRDSMLHVAGVLKLERPEPGYLAGSGGKGKGSTRADIGFSSPFRTVYLPVLRDLLPDEYGVFDFPDPSSIAGLRHITTAPPQALFFMNSRFVEDAAYKTVDRLFELAKTDKDRIETAYQITLGREAAADETESAFDLMSGLDTAGLKDPEGYRWAVFIQALFASAEFRYVL
jgi:hypothetical protein